MAEAINGDLPGTIGSLLRDDQKLSSNLDSVSTFLRCHRKSVGAVRISPIAEYANFSRVDGKLFEVEYLESGLIHCQDSRFSEVALEPLPDWRPVSISIPTRRP
jgi:hypothetical protein